jgi:hypothetical protein
MTLEGIPAAAEAASKIARYYLGDGSEFYAGVPARDLTDEDYAALSDAQRELVDRGHVTSSKAIEVREGEEPKYDEVRTRLYQKTKPRKEG